MMQGEEVPTPTKVGEALPIVGHIRSGARSYSPAARQTGPARFRFPSRVRPLPAPVRLCYRPSYEERSNGTTCGPHSMIAFLPQILFLLLQVPARAHAARAQSDLCAADLVVVGEVVGHDQLPYRPPHPDDPVEFATKNIDITLAIQRTLVGPRSAVISFSRPQTLELEDLRLGERWLLFLDTSNPVVPYYFLGERFVDPGASLEAESGLAESWALLCYVYSEGLTFRDYPMRSFLRDIHASSFTRPNVR